MTTINRTAVLDSMTEEKRKQFIAMEINQFNPTDDYETFQEFNESFEKFINLDIIELKNGKFISIDKAVKSTAYKLADYSINPVYINTGLIAVYEMIYSKDFEYTSDFSMIIYKAVYNSIRREQRYDTRYNQNNISENSTIFEVLTDIDSKSGFEYRQDYMEFKVYLEYQELSQSLINFSTLLFALIETKESESVGYTDYAYKASIMKELRALYSSRTVYAYIAELQQLHIQFQLESCLRYG